MHRRDEFEAFITEMHQAVAGGKGRAFTRSGDHYLELGVEQAWIGWKACMSTLLETHVPMPRQLPSWAEDAYDETAMQPLELPAYEDMLAEVERQQEVANA